MRTTARTTALVASLATLLVAGTALAGDHGRATRIVPASPVSIDQAVAAGAGTVIGTVTKVAGTWMVIDDGGRAIDVALRHAPVEGVAVGQRVTVTGAARADVIHASQIIRDDGSVITANGHQGRHEMRREG